MARDVELLSPPGGSTMDSSSSTHGVLSVSVASPIVADRCGRIHFIPIGRFVLQLLVFTRFSSRLHCGKTTCFPQDGELPFL